MTTPGYSAIFDKLSSIDTRLTVIEDKVTRLDRCVNGNGKPGMLDEVHRIDNDVAEIKKVHLKEENRKEKIDARWWSVIAIFIGQLAAWIFLVIRGLH